MRPTAVARSSAVAAAVCAVMTTVWMSPHGHALAIFTNPVISDRNGAIAGVADLDGDLDVDVVLAGFAGDFYGLLNNGDGTFVEVDAAISVGSLPNATVGRLDEDELPDVVTAGNGWIRRHYGVGDGTFEAPVFLDLPDGPALRPMLADVDGDADIVIGNYGFGNFAVMENLGGREFTSPIPVNLGVSPRDSALADFDGDGDTDLVGLDISTAVLIAWANGAGGFTVESIDMPEALAIAAADVK